MTRQYYQRGRLLEAEEIDGVVAVKVNADAPGGPAGIGAELGTVATEEIREAGVEEDVADAFARANWVLVRPAPHAHEAFATGEPLPGAETTGTVVRRPNGRIGIATAELTVRLDPALSEEEAERELAAARLTTLHKLSFAKNLYQVRAPSGLDSLGASVALHENDRFLFAEPAFVEHVPTRLRPTGARYAEQWQWHNTGANGGVPDADVHIEPAWDHTLGGGIRVAVIDNGFDAAHPDLADGVDPLSGFYTEDADGTVFAQDTAGMPDSDHGTFCAGMVGGRLSNPAGGTGAAPECDLMLVACLPDQVGTQTTLARAIAYTADPSTETGSERAGDGADILVCSLGPNGADWDITTTMELALEFAAAEGRRGKGLPVFWAASNGRNVDIGKDEIVSHPDVIAVVRSTNQDREDHAARGPEVELIAPGVNVLSTTSGGGYGTSTGTSFAAPCAAGCAALALAAKPGLTRDQLRGILHTTADKIGPPTVRYDAHGHNDDYGFGRINTVNALRTAQATPS
ncbi:S8 family serine peptidase [Streptomyces sp. UH6]|uniref:S8 family serine peptidase n=1 Tax=Streptomyces sp. UH6 TaxID=2748379 RepID=UPI0015D51C86|nr:S8 family serine peptidase [Streptomyces sp. UH6]NYV73700.1 S8 family serine peptidase [Streptomyces sp. UH6]